MLPPGRARLATNRLPTGSKARIMTMGIVFVTLCAATIEGLSDATITSTLSRTSSAARSGNRSVLPPDGRHSMATV